MKERSDYYWTAAASSAPEDDGRPAPARPGAEPAPEATGDYLRAAGDWLWEVDEHLNYTYLSKGVVRALGVPLEELLGSYIFSLTYFKEVDSDLLAIVEALQDRVAFRNQSVVLQDARGVQRVLTLSGVPVFDPGSGRFLGYRGTGREEKDGRDQRAEQGARAAVFRDFAEIAADWLWETDGELRVTYLSKGIEQLGGRAPEENLGRHLSELCDADETLRARLELRQPFRWCKVAWQQTAGAQARNVLLSGRPLLDEAGRFLGYRGVAADPGDGLAIDAQLLAAKQAAEEASFSKSEHLSNLSHELRTPLNAIIGFSDAMRNEIMGALPNDQYRQYVQDIHDSARHLLEMVNGVLDLSRIEAGKMDLDVEEVDVREAIDECRRMLREQADKARVETKLECDEDLPGLAVDRVKLKQILLNLLSNALKFTPPGGQVAVVARRIASGSLEIEVRDTGVGIDSDDIPKVLARFGQAAAGRGRQGTGLGLAITKSLVEMHGGVLKIVSGEGVGTRALVQFPKERVVSRPSGESEPWKILF
ncbi:MAG: PAS domain-containing sensor histidine kinase [Pseudomonadota bacterium]